MSDTVAVADDLLRSFFERWQRLEEEKQTISGDLKELFAEAKGQGFDTKAMRLVFRDMTKDRAEAQEFEAIYDLYWNSLVGRRAHPAHSAREIIEEFDAETGEITEQPETATKIPAQDSGGTALGESLGDKSNAGHPVSEQALADADLNDGTAAGQTAIEVVTGGESAATNPNPQPTTPTGADKAGDIAPLVSPATIADDDVPAFLRKERKPLRPHCLHPDDLEQCAGSGREHCHACTKAMGRVEEPA